jgi:hypothetical protein
LAGNTGRCTGGRFGRVLEMARELKVLRFSQLTPAANGTKVVANAR